MAAGMDREEVIIRAAEKNTARRMGVDLRQSLRTEQGMVQVQVPAQVQVPDLETVMEPAQKEEKTRQIRG